jgi:hypothetical protein
VAAPAPLSPNPPPGGEEQWEELSPDGLTRVSWSVTQGRMSHEMITPQLRDAATGALLLGLDPSFDGQIRWQEEGRFTLSLRHYIRAGAAAVEIDRPASRFRFVGDGTGPWLPVERLSAEVEARFTPSNAELDRQSRAFWAGLRANVPTPAQRRAARVQLALIVAALALAAIWWLS